MTFSFYDCMQAAKFEKGLHWSLMQNGSQQWQKMARVVPYRLVTLDVCWYDISLDFTYLRVFEEQKDSKKGLFITFMLVYIPRSTFRIYRVFRDTDDIEETSLHYCTASEA